MTARRLAWTPDPDVHGYASAISFGDGRLAEATVTVYENGSGASYDVFDLDGVTVVETGQCATVAAAQAAAERGMTRASLRLAT